MTKNIFRSMCAVALAAVIGMTVLVMGVLYGYFSRIQQTQLRMQTQLAAQGVELCGLDYFDGLDIRKYRVTWIDRDGAVLYDSASDSAGMEDHTDRPEVRQALDIGYGQSMRLSATLTERMLYSAQRLADGSVLRLALAESSVLAMLLGVGQGFAVVLVVILALSAFLARRLTGRIVEPLNAIDLDAPMENNAYPELEPLLRRMDAQQQRLRAQKAQLELDAAEKAEAEAMRRQFTANVSHELKTPLQTISGYAELLQNGMVRQEDIRPAADIISLSHLDEGAKDMPFEQTDLYAVAAEAVDGLTAEADRAGVRLSLDGERVALRGIPSLLHSIVFNLCENGIKYNRRGGHVVVSVAGEDGWGVLTVRDDGIGIPVEQQEHIFERFYRGDKSRSRQIAGTGLGLSIVKHAAIIHGAQIDLDSAPGQGTTVTVRFPLQQE